MARTLFDKIWEAHEVAPGLIYIDLHLVHEVTSPQAFESLRLAGRSGPARRPHARDGRPQRADRRLHRRCADPRPPLARAGRDARAQLPRVRRARLLDRLEPPGDRARDRARAGRDAARDDDRLRRLAHLHARRLRRAGLRHRDERGRARPGHADAAAGEAALDGHPLRGRARLRRDREGPDPRHDRPDRDRRRSRARHRVRRPRDREALDGGPDDRLQHDDRGRRPRGHDRARRHDVRVGRSAARRRRPSCPDEWRDLHTDDGAAFDKEVVGGRGRAVARRSPGARRPGWSCRSPRPCPSRRPRPTSAR